MWSGLVGWLVGSRIGAKGETWFTRICFPSLSYFLIACWTWTWSSLWTHPPTRPPMVPADSIFRDCCLDIQG